MGSKTEVLSFDIDEYNYHECQVHNHGFYLGEQSKQDEVDELKKRIDEAWRWCEKGCILKAMAILKGEETK